MATYPQEDQKQRRLPSASMLRPSDFVGRLGECIHALAALDDPSGKRPGICTDIDPDTCQRST